ncbi:MAG: hydantoinase/oxoprolinase family protein, partial [Pseudomonadota bacterium]|nr:hydantoinase/oxoprolinase family protein [Pseudomonadota bacterium]
MDDVPTRRYANIGVDTGGTFTDLVTVDDAGVVHTEKAFSTPDAPQDGVFDVLSRAAITLNTSVPDILSRTNIFAHGTTVSTNVLITRKGAKVGALFTAGFEDTLAIGRGPIGRVGGLPQTLAMDFIHTEPPLPIVPPDMVCGVPERVDSAGTIICEINLKATREAVTRLIAAGAESFAVCFLWAFRNPRHEESVAEICRELAPDLPVSLSHKIAPRIGEFERAVTTIVNAYVAPITTRYISELDRRLSNKGLRTPIQVVTSSGGAARAVDMDVQAVNVVNSGPVAGLVAARFLGDQLGHTRIITADMGGTSFDVGLIDGKRLEEDPNPFLDQGMPVSVPAVKIVTIGAGGGSIAWTDGYRLKVGPQSGGANPGPAAYARGGTEPTVTDALVVCGFIDPQNFFGGGYVLDPDLAARAIWDKIATPLEMNLYDAGAGILEIVNARMANLIRKVSIESGHDPKEFALYAYGGATGTHCADFARQLGIGKLVLPYTGPVFSALGAAISDLHYTQARSEPVILDTEAIAAANRSFGELWNSTNSNIKETGLEYAACIFQRRIEMRYQGQLNEITIDWNSDELTVKDIGGLRRAFEAHYERRFGPGTTRPESPLELVSFRIDTTYPTRRPTMSKLETGNTSKPPSQTRPVYLRNRGFVDTEIYDFDGLLAEVPIPGPAIIERKTT